MGTKSETSEAPDQSKIGKVSGTRKARFWTKSEFCGPEIIIDGGYHWGYMFFVSNSKHNILCKFIIFVDFGRILRETDKSDSFGRWNSWFLNKISVFESWNHDKTQLSLHIVEIKFDPKTVQITHFLVILQNIEIDRKYEADTQNMWFFVFCEGNMTFH